MKQSSNKKAIDEKRNQLLQLHTKIDNILEDRNNRVLDANSYAKWFTRYSLEKSTIESEIDNMSKPADSVIKKYEATLPLLTDIHYIYHKADTPHKHFILNGVFEQGLQYDGSIFRTPSILEVFASKAATLKEKRLLIVEQPLEKIPKIWNVARTRP